MFKDIQARKIIQKLVGKEDNVWFKDGDFYGNSIADLNQKINAICEHLGISIDTERAAVRTNKK